MTRAWKEAQERLPEGWHLDGLSMRLDRPGRGGTLRRLDRCRRRAGRRGAGLPGRPIRSRRSSGSPPLRDSPLTLTGGRWCHVVTLATWVRPTMGAIPMFIAAPGRPVAPVRERAFPWEALRAQLTLAARRISARLGSRLADAEFVGRSRDRPGRDVGPQDLQLAPGGALAGRGGGGAHAPPAVSTTRWNHTVVTWDRLAEICGQYLGKGPVRAVSMTGFGRSRSTLGMTVVRSHPANTRRCAPPQHPHRGLLTSGAARAPPTEVT